MSLIVYGDFTDPLSRVASQRVDALQLTGHDVQWRAVAHHHTTQVVAGPVSDRTHEHLEAVRRWWSEAALPGESVVLSEPRNSPCPDPPVAAYAEAMGASVADHVRALLFDAFWRDGEDIGNPDVLRRLLAVPMIHGDSRAEVHSESGYAVAVGGGPLTTDGWRRMGAWRREWVALGRPGLPAVCDGTDAYTGFEALDHLGSLLGGTRVPIGAVAGNPHALPPLPLAARRVGIDRPGRRRTWWEA
ncbi:MAG: hypothetical protein WCA30_18465 [Dermatophilaceae bacterium]